MKDANENKKGETVRSAVACQVVFDVLGGLEGWHYTVGSVNKRKITMAAWVLNHRHATVNSREKHNVAE